jgi:predicted transcriptional regulator
MSFEIVITSNTPIVSEKELEKVAKEFLTQIGYIAKGSDPKIPLELFLECFLKRADKAWLVDELALKLNTSRPTIYRHLNKLKSYDLLEELPIESDNQKKKAYRLRYSNFSKAWNFVEAHAKVALENYRKTVEHIQKLLESY